MSSHLKIVMFLLLRDRMNFYFFQMEYTENLDGIQVQCTFTKAQECVRCVCGEFFFFFFFSSFIITLPLRIFMAPPNRAHT